MTTTRRNNRGSAYLMVGNGMGTGVLPVFGPMSFKRARTIIESYPESGYTIQARIDVEREFGGNPIVKAN